MRRNIAAGLNCFPLFRFHVEDENDVARKIFRISVWLLLDPAPDENFTVDWMSDKTFTDWPSTRPIAFEDWRQVDESLTGEFT